MTLDDLIEHARKARIAAAANPAPFDSQIFTDYGNPRPLREGEMRTCDRCGAAQLGPGAWAYAGPVCYCAIRRFVAEPAREPIRPKPRIRVKAGSSPA